MSIAWFLISYLLPFAAFAAGARNAYTRWRWRGAWGLYLAAASLGGMLFSIVGAARRRELSRGGWSVVGAAIAIVGFAVVMLPSLLAFAVTQRCRMRGTSQVIIVALSTVLVAAFTWTLFALSVGCVVSGDCI